MADTEDGGTPEFLLRYSQYSVHSISVYLHQSISCIAIRRVIAILCSSTGHSHMVPIPTQYSSLPESPESI